MIAEHLNAPYGPVVSARDVTDSLLAGAVTASTIQAQAILNQIFIECQPALIAACAIESGASYKLANDLYLNTLTLGGQRVLEWERSIEHLV